ncbi:STAS domain-containing protein [Halobacillus salinarum]|uniref:STAS domain-containing protein n=1 Tax=Halobacillus salinarum TaxID=2932257 RepID=A0ABY4EHE2_9BACI|nr:STAS domain-containing protein [Halobacillus salinarum]UOQ43881.1 STAS domain-containing protein [Halobacillus salinarum]
MQRNKDLYHYLMDKAEKLTKEWYESLDKSDPTGVYASRDPEVIRNLKKQNFEFHQHVCKVFIEEKQVFLKDFDQWLYKIATDDGHLRTPTHFIMREFIRVRNQYLEFIEIFSKNRNEPQHKIDLWKSTIIEVFDTALLRFTEEKSKYTEKQLEEQQHVINDNSSPVIDLTNGKALLPLVGEIDEARAATILENTLQDCMKKAVSHLFIDLSGVFMVDTMVAHQIFQLLQGLKLIGVNVTLSGIRPEIAQTAVQLGIDFKNIPITSTLAQALATMNE